VIIGHIIIGSCLPRWFSRSAGIFEKNRRRLMVNAPNNTDTQTVEVLRKTQMALISDPEAAKRLARTIISDITIYNKEKVKEGLRNDNLFDVLKIDLEKGRKVYESKVSPEIVQTTNFYDLAIVDIMVQQATDMYSKI
jgi:hypothetical protein